MAKRIVQSAGQNSEGRQSGNTDSVEARPSAAKRAERSDTGDAFFPDPQDGPARAPDDLAETLAEDYLQSALSGSNVDDEVLNQVVAEEIGGPFVETTAGEEFAAGVDESNPEDATVEARPMAVSGVVERPPE